MAVLSQVAVLSRVVVLYPVAFLFPVAVLSHVAIEPPVPVGVLSHVAVGCAVVGLGWLGVGSVGGLRSARFQSRA